MRCDLKGKSGEQGCLQYMPQTWRWLSQKHIGYVAPQSQVNELYVAILEIQTQLNRGLNEHTIFLKWNGGDGRIKSGYNKLGVWYDTGHYAQKALAYYGE